MVTSEVLERRLTLPFWMGLVAATGITASVVVANVLHETSQRWGQYGGPYSYGFWLAPSLGLVMAFGVLALVAHAGPRWHRFAVGLAVGAVVGVVLSFVFTAFFFKHHTDSYLINRPECIDNAHPSGSASCLNREQRELREQQREAPIENDRWP